MSSLVAAGLVERGEGVERAELRPGDRRHLGGGVELHRAAAQRDHRAVERHVLVRQRAQVAQHLGLGAVGREHRVGEVLRGAGQVRGVGRAASGEVVTIVTPKATATRSITSGVVVSSRATPTVWSSSLRRLSPWRSAEASTSSASAGHPHGERVEEVGVDLEAALHAASGPARRPARGPARRWPAGPRARGTRRTSRRSRRGAPGRCRCWRWPSPGGCAARGSAARGGGPGGRRRRRTRRRGGRASSGAGPRGWRGTRRGGRRSRAARRSAATSRRRRRRPAHPAGRGRCRPAGRWRRRRARRAACTWAMVGDRSRTTPVVPGCWSRAPKQAVGSRSSSAPDDELDADGLGPGGHHGDRSAGGSRRRRRTRWPRAWSSGGSGSWPRPRRWTRRASSALARSMPVRSVTIVWKLRRASSRPWLISGWYGVYAVYQAGDSSTLRRITPGVWVPEYPAPISEVTTWLRSARARRAASTSGSEPAAGRRSGSSAADRLRAPTGRAARPGWPRRARPASCPRPPDGGRGGGRRTWWRADACGASGGVGVWSDDPHCRPCGSSVASPVRSLGLRGSGAVAPSAPDPRPRRGGTGTLPHEFVSPRRLPPGRPGEDECQHETPGRPPMLHCGGVTN